MIFGLGYANGYRAYAGLNVALRKMTFTDNALPAMRFFNIQIMFKKNLEFCFQRSCDDLASSGPHNLS